MENIFYFKYARITDQMVNIYCAIKIIKLVDILFSGAIF